MRYEAEPNISHVLLRERIAAWLPNKLYEIHIDPDDQKRITELQRLLSPKEAPNNLIIYFNHIAYDDPVFSLYLARLLDSKNLRKLVLPGSKWHTEWKNNRKFAASALLGKLLYGVAIPPVVQSYMLDEWEKWGYKSKDEAEVDATRSYKKLLRKITSLHTKKRPLTILISPEGHRSETGALGGTKGIIEPGMLTMGKILTPVIFCPLGIEYPDGFTRDVNFHPLKHRPHVHLTLGELTFQPNRQTDVSLDALIRNLARTLPSHMRGLWG